MQKKKATQNNIFNLLFKALISFVKYFLLGIYFTLYIIFRLVTDFLYYLGVGLATPFLLLGKGIKLLAKKTKPLRDNLNRKYDLYREKRDNNNHIKEARQLRLEEKKYIRQYEEKQKRLQIIQEKQKKIKEQNLEKKEKKKKENDVYINKDVKIENQTGRKLQEIVQKIKGIPAGIGDKFKNNKFAKNRRNKKDIKRQALLINFEGEDAEKSDTKQLYKYIAKDPTGKVVKGVFEAFSKVEVHSFLLSEGFEVYSIKTNKWITLFHGKDNVNRTKFKTKDLIFFIAQLSTYLKAGITLVEAIKILAKQFSKNKKYEKIFKSIIYDLTMGENFSNALLKQGEAFPKLFINMVKTAEMTGELPEVLDDMYEYYTEADKTRKQMITAITYPSIVLVFAIGVIIFILVYVIPKFAEIYSTMDAASIPAFTKLVMAASDFIKSYALWIFIGIIAFVVINIVLYKKVKGFRTIMQWLVMHMPVFGDVVIYNEVTMFTKTFGSLLSHNVFITESMDVLNKMTNNEIYKMLILDTITNLARGEKISTAFENHWAFPIPAYEMLVTGERTGELADMMHKVSVYYQELHKEQVQRIKTFIEPILTVFLTVIVGVIVLAIVVPMFNMYQAVQSY